MILRELSLVLISNLSNLHLRCVCLCGEKNEADGL